MRFFALLVFLSGCRSVLPPSEAAAHANTHVAPVQDASLPAPDAALPPDPRVLATACERVRSRSAERINTFFASRRSCGTDRVAAVTQRYARCEQRSHEGWAVEMLSMETSEGGCLGRWQLVHLDEHGNETTFLPGASIANQRPTQNYRNDRSGSDGLEALQLSDLNGDGHNEVFVKTLRTERDPVEREQVFVVYTLREGRVLRYEPAQRIEIARAVDHDNDGRLDLVSWGPYVGVFPKCEGGEDTFGGPEFLLHTRSDGTFANDDEAALEYVRAQCRRVSPALFASFDENDYRSYVRVGKAVACARLRGVSSERVLAQLAERCRSYGDPHPCEQDALPEGQCPAFLQRWARERALLTLR